MYKLVWTWLKDQWWMGVPVFWDKRPEKNVGSKDEDCKRGGEGHTRPLCDLRWANGYSNYYFTACYPAVRHSLTVRRHRNVKSSLSSPDFHSSTLFSIWSAYFLFLSYLIFLRVFLMLFHLSLNLYLSTYIHFSVFPIPFSLYIRMTFLPFLKVCTFPHINASSYIWLCTRYLYIFPI